MIYNKTIMYYCRDCSINFITFQEKANNVRWIHKREQTIKNFSEGAKRGNIKRFGKWIEEEINCFHLKCNNIINIRFREKIGKKEKYFCCRSCANSRFKSEILKQNLSKTISNLWKKGIYDNLDTTKNKKIFSSKREREIVKHFKTKFPDIKFKSGGSLKFNNLRIVRDLYSDDLKICFEYDGIWHFKNIHGQLEDKQLKDKALENWCIENNYRLIRIRAEEELTNIDIEKLIFERKEPIIKIGNYKDIEILLK